MAAGAPDPKKAEAEALYAEFLRRAAEGDRQNLSELCGHHPQLADELLELYERNETVSMRAPAETDHHEDFGSPPAALTTPQRYGILERLAQGGMGIIYKVWDGRLHRELAMKLIRDKKNRDIGEPAASVKPESLARFMREAEITARLDHPGVVPIHDMGTDEQGRVFFTMRLVQGQRLDTVFELARLATRRWNQTRVLDVIVRICETVAFAHSRGVIHRDLKPSNIMVGRFGETYVMDWGLAKNLRDSKPAAQAPCPIDAETVVYEEGGSSSRLGTSDLLRLPNSDMETLAGAVLGTAAYMPPEQAAGHVAELDERSDIYSVGAILYELLAGRRPYTIPGQAVPRSREIILAVIAGPPTALAQANPRVPAELAAICEKAMERRKDDRYQSMTEMAEDLRAYLENRVVRAHQTGALAELRKWVARNRWTAVASAAGIVTAVALLITVVGVQSAANKTLSEKNLVITQANEKIVSETRLKDQALVQETEARRRADEELARAEGLILARAATDALATNVGQSLLVALESARRHPGDAANTAILSALAEHHEAHVLRGHRAPIQTAAVSADGSRLVTASDDHTAILWNTATGEPLHWLLGHDGGIRAIAITNDGQRVATSSAFNQTVRVWNAATGELSLVIKTPEFPVSHLTFTARGDRLAACTYQGSAAVWDAATGDRLLDLSAGTARLSQIAFSPDDSQLLAAGSDRAAHLWDAATGAPIRDFANHEGNIGIARFSRDGKLALTAVNHQADNQPEKENHPASVRVWNAATGEVLASLPHPSSVERAVFSRDAERVVTSSADGAIRWWNVQNATVEKQWEVRGSAVNGLAVSPDDRLIAASTKSGAVWLWNIATGAEISLRGHTDVVRSLAFLSPLTLITASLDRTARVWNVHPPGAVDPPESGKSARTEVEISPDGARLLVRQVPSPTAMLVSFPDASPIAALEHASPLRSVHFSPDGTRVVAVTEAGAVHVFSAIDGRLEKIVDESERAWFGVFSGDSRLVVAPLAEGRLTVWNTADWTPERSQEFPQSRMTRISPDGTRVFTWPENSSNLELWPTGSSEKIASLPVIADPAREIPLTAFSRDARILATWSVKQSPLRLWNLETGRQIATVGSGGRDPVFDHDGFSPDGKLIGMIWGDSTVEIRDAATAALVARLGGHESPIAKVFIGPGGTRVITRSADQLSRLWNGQTGESLGLLVDRDDFFHRVEFSRDGRRLLTITGKGDKATLWNAHDGIRLARVFSGRTLFSSEAFSSGAFSPDGRWIATGFQDGSVRIWPADPVEFATSLPLRALTPEERDLFNLGTPRHQAEYRHAASARFLDAFLLLATKNSQRFDQPRAIQAACERLLRDFLQSTEGPDERGRSSRLQDAKRSLSRRAALTPPVSTAFDTLAAEIDQADRDK